MMFLCLRRDDRVINLNYVKEFEYNEKINMLYIKADEIYTYYCTRKEYEEFVTKIDALEGVIV